MNNGMNIRPSVIISMMAHGKTSYVRGVEMDAYNKRKATLTDDVAKARRFWSEVDAHNYITHFVAEKKANYSIEKFAPAA